MADAERNSGKNRESSFEPVRRILFLYHLMRRSSAGRKLTAQKAFEQMKSSGFEVSLRTVQRYLEVCETYFAGVRHDEGNPRGWWWEANTADDFLQLSKESALALCLAEAHLKHLIPTSELKHLASLFEQAKKTIGEGGKANRYKNMLERIWIMPRGLQLIPPNVDGLIFDRVLSAILESTEITMSYKKPSEKSPRQRVIEPVGMVERSGVYYVVGREKYGEEHKNWALHRIIEVKENSSFAYPKHFKISNWAKNGQTNVRMKPDTILLKLRLDEVVAAHLQEAKLKEGQKTITLEDGSVELSCSIENTLELRWWLMSIAHQCEILEPPSLRNEVIEMLGEAIAKYSTGGKKRAS